MSHVTTDYIGKAMLARKTNTTAVTPTIGRICQLDETDKRHQRGSKGQTQVCTHRPLTDGFLKWVFLPRLKTEQSTQAPTENTKMEKDFYASLTNLATHYDIEPMPTREYGYPYNVALALWDVQTKLKDSVASWDTVRLAQDKKGSFLLSEERYRTGTSLYYIPVIPIYRMLNDHKRKRTAQLLLSVCCYLYRNAGIPYYREENSYLYWQYEMLQEWMEDDDENQEYAHEFYQAQLIGDSMGQKMFNLANLTTFERRLQQFKAKDEFDHSCHELAKEAFEILTLYPNENVFRNTSQQDEDPDQEQETITMDRYISFWADDKGWLSQNLIDNINTEFNEYGHMEEPTLIKKFDKNRTAQHSLDFENRLFPLLDNLCYLLNHY